LDQSTAWTTVFGADFLSRQLCMEIANAAAIDTTLPALSLTVDGLTDSSFDLHLLPTRSLAVPFRIDSTRTAYCPGVAALPADSPYAVLGWSVTGQFGVVYAGDRIGFSPVHRLPCDGLVSARPLPEPPTNSSFCISAAEATASPTLAAVAMAFFGLLSAPFFPLWNCPWISEN
jgi:hypothetical protein